MASLRFMYGVVGSGKTLSLVTTSHGYKQTGKILIIKPEIDKRVEGCIKSRAGLQCPYDYSIESLKDIKSMKLKDVKHIFVDEAQFFSSDIIDELRNITKRNINVFCYGLKTDFKGNLFEGSKRLMEIADECKEITTICSDCGQRNATMSLRLINGERVYEGKQVDLGFNKYKPVCWFCY